MTSVSGPSFPVRKSRISHELSEPMISMTYVVQNIRAKRRPILMSVYGYARVSTDGQTLDAQVAHLKGCRSRKGLPREGERRKGRSTRMHSCTTVKS
jgi:hypothetical protein